MSSQVFKRLESVVRREIAGEVFLVPIHGNLADLQQLFVLNEVGSWIWSCLDRPRGLAELAAGIASEFEVDEQHAFHDAESFLRNLVDAGLAEEVQAEAV